MQDIAGAQCAPRMPAELTQDEGRTAAEIRGHVDASTHREVRARSRTIDVAHGQRRACRHFHRSPTWNRYPVELRLHVRATQRDYRVGFKLQVDARYSHFQPRRVTPVTHDAVGHPESEHVYWTGRRH